MVDAVVVGAGVGIAETGADVGAVDDDVEVTAAVGMGATTAVDVVVGMVVVVVVVAMVVVVVVVVGGSITVTGVINVDVDPAAADVVVKEEDEETFGFVVAFRSRTASELHDPASTTRPARMPIRRRAGRFVLRTHPSTIGTSPSRPHDSDALAPNRRSLNTNLK